MISVIVPVYKTEPYLHRCVDSILAQTYPNLEIILIDDGSPDRCGEICDEYAAKDSRIQVIHQENSGLSVARNTGLDICTGEYIAFVDSDDYVEPDMYKKKLDTLLEHQVDICVCQWQYEYADGRQVVDISKVNPAIFGKSSSLEFSKFLYRGSYENGVVVAAWNKLYNRERFGALRFSGRYMEDDAIHSVLFSKDFPVYVIKEQCYVYCENVSSLTHQCFRQESLRILDIMAERTRLFCGEPFIVCESKRTYCNLYIEYYYKAKEAGIPMPGRSQFVAFAWNLIRRGNGSVKFAVRMLLFLMNPELYRYLLLR